MGAELKRDVVLLFIGGEELSAAEKGYGYGADKVITVWNPELAHYMSDSYLQVMTKIAKDLNPSLILFAQNDKGLDLASRLAFRLKTGVALDCVELKIDSATGSVLFTKPVFGGKAHVHYQFMGKGPQIASVREGAYAPAPYDASRTGDIKKYPVTLDTDGIRTRFIKKEIDDSQALVFKLASAETVVSGGRGLKTKEGMELLQETANLLGGAVAGSRAAIDQGWLPGTLQVGLTGKKVSPRLYIAAGISGALQHMAGCANAKNIVAINTDEEAPIYKMSHVGVVGDCKEVMEGFNDEVRNIQDVV